MPDEVIKKTIPELPAGAIIQGSLFENAQPNVQASTGYNSVKVTADDVSNYVATTKTYSQLQTTSKTIVSAINEAAQSGGGGASVIQKTLAEYQALPQSSKMNGSIYKITDKALIYCLDEEYHAYKELTSIQYQALTSDEKKNNGTLYIITDEETTADDIPYTTGVSVGDVLNNLSGIKIAIKPLSAVFSNSNISANIGNAKTLFELDNDDTIDFIGSFCNGQPLVAFTNSTGGLFCGAVLGQLNATYAFTAICFYH